MIDWINNFSTLGHKESDTPELRIQKSFLVFLATFMSCGGVLWGTIALANGLVEQSLIPYGYVLLSVINLIYLKQSKNFSLVRFFQVLISLILPFLFQSSLGGFFPSGAILLWATLALVASLSFQDVRTSFMWLGLFVLGTILSAYFDEYFFASKPEILPSQSLLFIVLNVTIITSIFFGLVIYFVLNNRKIRSQLEQKTSELQELNFELKKSLDEKQKAYVDLESTQSKLIASEKMASLGVLSAGIGHEINNPLNYIKGGIQGLSVRINQEDKQMTAFVDIINDGVGRAVDIVQSLSHFSRTGVNIDERCDIHKILDNCLVILNSKLKNKVQVEKEFHQEPVISKGNEGRLHQAFLNIISNAEQATSKQAAITIKTQVTANEITVSISDNGSGIAQEHLNKIMDPFFTTKEPGKGTGLGLSISQKIVEEHNGRIEVTSEIGKGTNFHIVLPSIPEGEL